MGGGRWTPTEPHIHIRKVEVMRVEAAVARRVLIASDWSPGPSTAIRLMRAHECRAIRSHQADEDSSAPGDQEPYEQAVRA